MSMSVWTRHVHVYHYIWHVLAGRFTELASWRMSPQWSALPRDAIHVAHKNLQVLMVDAWKLWRMVAKKLDETFCVPQQCVHLGVLI
jgi:hypothetical protein